MKIRIQNGLPFVQVSIDHRDQQKTLDDVLLDTGSTGTIFSADKILEMGLQLESQDVIHQIRGVGGAEFVFTKRIDCLSLGKFQLKDFEIEVGTMDYGFAIEGIVGLNFLRGVGACINLAELEIS